MLDYIINTIIYCSPRRSCNSPRPSRSNPLHIATPRGPSARSRACSRAPGSDTPAGSPAGDSSDRRRGRCCPPGRPPARVGRRRGSGSPGCSYRRRRGLRTRPGCRSGTSSAASPSSCRCGGGCSRGRFAPDSCNSYKHLAIEYLNS